MTVIPASCPPEQWVQDLIDAHQGRTEPPAVQQAHQAPLNAPGAHHHARTMPPKTRSDVMRLVTFNTLHTPPGAGNDWDPGDPGPAPRWVQDIRDIIAWADPDLIGLQEAVGAESDITQAFGGAGGDWNFQAYDGTGSMQQCPVMLRKGRWTDIDSKHIYGCPAGQGATPPEEWISQVTATHVTTGQRMRFFNFHLPSHVDDNGTPRDLPRQDLYRQCVTALTHAVMSTPDTMLCFAMGDTNTDYRNPRGRRVDWWPMKALGGQQMVSNWYYKQPPGGTMGGSTSGGHVKHRLIDQVFHRRTPQVQWTGNGILYGLGSDHNAVKAAYRVTRHVTAQDSSGNPNRGGSNTPNQGHHDDRSHQANLNRNQPVDLDVFSTANLCFSYTDVEHQNRIDEITGVRGAAVTFLQELVAKDTQPRWTATQPNQPDNSPAGQALLVRNDLATPMTGSVRASTMVVAGIQARYYPWADIDLTFLDERVRVVCVHMPPKRMPQALKDDYGATLRAFLATSPHPWIVGGDWNIALAKDPYNLTGAFRARWYGQGIDGFAVHPDLHRYVGGDGGRKYVVDDIRTPNPDGHPLVRLRLCRVQGHQRSDQPNHT